MIELKPLVDFMTEVCDAEEVQGRSLRGFYPAAMFEVEEIRGGKTEWNYQTSRNETTPAEKVKVVKFLMARSGQAKELAARVSELEARSSEHYQARKAAESDRDLLKGLNASLVAERDALQGNIAARNREIAAQAERTQKMERDLAKVRTAIGEREMKKILEGS